MKGKRTFKRFLAVVMAVVFTATGITFTPKSATNADVIDYTFGATLTNVTSNAENRFGTGNRWGFQKNNYTSGDVAKYGVTNDNSAVIYYPSTETNSQDYLRYRVANGDLTANTTYDVTITAQTAAQVTNNPNYTVFNSRWVNTSSATGFGELRPWNQSDKKTCVWEGQITTGSNPNNVYMEFGLEWYGNFGLQQDQNSVKVTMNIRPEGETTTPADGYYDCVVGGGEHDFGNNWKYIVSNPAKYRYGNYDSKTFLAELKNTHTASQSDYVWAPSGTNPLTNGTTYDYSVTFYSTAAITGVEMTSYYSSAAVNIGLGDLTANNTTTLTGSFTAADDFSGVWQFLLPNIPAGAEVGITDFTITAQPAGPTDPTNIQTTRDSATAGTISWTHDAAMPSGQIYYIYDGNTKIGETTAQSNTSYQVTGIADFNAHTYTVKGYSSGNTSTGVSATIPAFDPWIKLNNQTVDINGGDDGSLYGYGNQEIGYYYGSLTSLRDLKTKQFRNTPYDTDGYAEYEEINLPASTYTGLASGHTYKMRLKYKASATGGYMILKQHGENQSNWTVGEIENSGNTDNTLVADNSFVYNSGTTYNGAKIVLGAVATGTEISDIRVDFVDLTTPVAPASVIATRSTSTWNGIDISFTAGSGAPAGQTYSIEVGGVEIEDDASPGTTYSTTIAYDTNVTVEVIAHIASQEASTTTTINIPEYKPFSQFNSDAMNTDYEEYYGDHANIVYKIDSNGVHLKNTNQSGVAGMNLIYKGSLLSETVPYYPEFYYTSDTADTQNISYGIFTNNTIPKGSRSKTTSTSGENNFGFLVTPTAEQVAANAKAYINWNIPAGAEFTLTRTTGYKALDPSDAVGVTASSTNANEVTVTWTDNHCPSYQIYEIALFDSNGTQVGSTVEETTMYNTYTFTNVPKGSNYTVNIKARVDQVYASAGGVTSSAVDVHDPAPVAPASVVATRSTTVWNGVNISFVAGQDVPAGETYSIEVDGNVIENNALPGTTYATTVSYDVEHTVVVKGHSDGTTAQTSTTITVPEYKEMNDMNTDPFVPDYGVYYPDSNLKYKIDSNGNLRIKNFSDSINAATNFIYQKYNLTSNTSYLATVTYTSDTAYTQAGANYGVDSLTEGRCVSQGQTDITTAAASGNQVSFMVTPTAAQVTAGDAQAYINFVIPANGEYTITNFTLTTADPPEDLVSVGATANTANQIDITFTKPSQSQAPTNQVYEIYRNDTSAGTSTLIDTVAYNATGYTMTNVPSGTYTITVKARVASTYASQAGVTSGSVSVHDEWIPVAAGDQGAVPIGGDGTDLYNAYSGNVEYYYGTDSALLDTLRVKTTSTPTAISAAWQNAIRIPNDVLYSTCTAGHKYRMTVYYTATGSNVGGTLRVHQQGYGLNGDDEVTSGSNYAYIDFISDANHNTQNNNTQIQLAAINAGTEIKVTDISFVELPQPINSPFGITSSGGTSLTASWSDPDAAVGLVQSYKVTLLDSTGQTVVRTEDTTSAKTYTWTGLTVNTTYTVRVIATKNNFDATAVTQQGLTDPWIRMTAGQTINIGSNTGASIFSTYDVFAYYYGTTSTDLNSVRLKQYRENTETNPDATYHERVDYANANIYSQLTTGHRYRATMTYDAANVTNNDGGNVYLYPGGVTLQSEPEATDGHVSDAVTSGGNSVTYDFKYNTAGNNVMQIRFSGVKPGVELSNIDFDFEELPTEVAGVGIGVYGVGLYNAGGNHLQTTWDDQIQLTGTTYKVSLCNSSGTPLYTKTVAGTESEYTFHDGDLDDNNQRITINPNTEYRTQVVTVVGNEESPATPSDRSVNTGVWMRMGGLSSAAEDVLDVDSNTRVSSMWGNLYYDYRYTSTLSSLILKKSSASEPVSNYAFYKVGQKNSTVFNGIDDGANVRVTATFTANAAASGTIRLQSQVGTTPTYADATVTSGSNTISVDCYYDSAHASDYTDLLLGGLGADTEITGISFSVQVLETWTPGTADGGWHDVGDYGYHIPENLVGYYSTDTAYQFALKTSAGERWTEYYVGTNEMTVYPGSTYRYSINANRSKYNQSSDDDYNRAYLVIRYNDGTEEGVANTIPTASGDVSFSGIWPIPSDKTSARLYIKFQYPAADEKFSMDLKTGSKYVFEEVWRAVDKTQDLRNGNYTISDKDGGEIQYKPSEVSGMGAVNARVVNGTQYDPYNPYIKTNFDNWGLQEGKEYIATVKMTPDKDCTGLRLTGYGDQGLAMTANTEASFDITFIYREGYDIKASFGWLGHSNTELSNFSVTLHDGAASLPLTNTDGHVVADWSNVPGVDVSGATKLVFTSKEETKIVDITGYTSYEFGEGDGKVGYPDNNTEVELYTSYTEGNPGTKLLRATALADLTITSANVNHDGVAHANTNNPIYINIKNVGTGMVYATTTNGQFIYITAKVGTWKNYKYFCPDPYNKIPVFLRPNETTEQEIDAWRVQEEGVYSIKCQVNETKLIKESSYSNNSYSLVKEITTQVADDTAVLGFQLNSNKNPGSASELSPSYRTVCRASKHVTIKDDDYAFDEDGNRLSVPVGTYNVTEYGFVYAYHDEAGLTSKNEDELMTFAGAKSNDYIKTLKANSEVDIDEWTTKEGSTYNKDNSYFFALTLKDLYYTTDQFETVYTFRSYLKFNIGGTDYIVYPKDVYSTSMYDIAEDLYRYKKMPSQAGHEYLYDEILNITSMKHNASKIGRAMMVKLNAAGLMPSAASQNYKNCNMAYQDMMFYALCSDPEGKTGGQYDGMKYLYADNIKRVKKDGAGPTYEIAGEPAGDETVIQSAYTYQGYTYTHDRKEFRSVRLDEGGYYDNFLADLNTSTNTSYDSLDDWIYGEVPHDTGYYKKVEYSWDSNLDKDYGTE